MQAKALINSTTLPADANLVAENQAFLSLASSLVH
jgi:hypothetical protein